MRRRALVLLVAVLVVLAVGCGGRSVPAPSVASSAAPESNSPTESVSSSPSVEPVGVPEGTPASFDKDVEPSEITPEALVPANATVSDVWYVETSAGSSILIGYVVPGTDPLRQEHGLVVWRRFPGDPEPWRPVFGFLDPPTRGVLQINAVVGDTTGDGSPDALTFEDTGGSGVCGMWRVLDLAANTSVFTKRTCDMTIDISIDPVGLVVREAVFKPEDAHCCPSATRTTVLIRDGSEWKVYSSSEQPF